MVFKNLVMRNYVEVGQEEIRHMMRSYGGSANVTLWHIVAGLDA